jgi:hypothetical protein
VLSPILRPVGQSRQALTRPGSLPPVSGTPALRPLDAKRGNNPFAPRADQNFPAALTAHMPRNHSVAPVFEAVEEFGDATELAEML